MTLGEGAQVSAFRAGRRIAVLHTEPFQKRTSHLSVAIILGVSNPCGQRAQPM